MSKKFLYKKATTLMQRASDLLETIYVGCSNKIGGGSSNKDGEENKDSSLYRNDDLKIPKGTLVKVGGIPVWLKEDTLCVGNKNNFA